MITCQVISSVIEMFLVMTCLDLAEKSIEHIACVQLITSSSLTTVSDFAVTY